MFGCRCVIYMNDGVSAGREEAIAAYGAEVVRVPGSYDRAVQRSYADAERFGYFAISDEKSAEYPHISREIMQGYAMIADEIVRQFSDDPAAHSCLCPRRRRSLGRGDLRAFVGAIREQPSAGSCR